MISKKQFSSSRTLVEILPYLLNYKWTYIIGFIFMFLQNYSYVKLSEYIKWSLAEITGNNQDDSVYHLLSIVLLLLLLTCFFMFVMRHLIISNSRKIEYEIRSKLFKKLLSLPVQFYHKEQTGDLVSRLTNDLQDLRTLLGPGIMYVPNSISRIAFFIPAMFAISPMLVMIILSQMTLLVIIILLATPKLRPFYRRVQETRANINNHAWQIISGITTIKLNTMEKTQTNFFGGFSLAYFKELLVLEKIHGIIWPFFFFFFSLSQSVILFVGGKEIISGEIKIEELLQFSVMIGVMIFPIMSLGWVMSILQQGVSSWERLSKIFNEPVDKKKINNLPKVPLAIVCQNIRVMGNHDEEILKNISFKIAPGKMIGITGLTGSGKTVLLEAITGLLPVTSGKVLVGGMDIATVQQKSLYQRIAFASQESFLFSSSIKNNIGFEGGVEPLQNRVEYSAQIADIAKDIQGFPEQYEQILGERGINLSGGQKQRTSLSRAIYKEAEILIFDDSLSAVDSKTEEMIINNLKELKSLKTIIVVSHRISILKFVDEIFFLKNGKLTERGSHKKLLTKGGGYSRLAKLQKLKEQLA